MQVGIPRALFYYHYYPLWHAFFGAMDVGVLVSPPTHKRLLTDGVQRITSDTCLPAKIYCGHVAALAGQVDYILVPLIRRLSVSDEQNCPRFLGLPGLVRAAVPDVRLLAPEIDLKSGSRGMLAAILQLALPFTHDPLRVKRAVEQGLDAHARYQALRYDGLSAPSAIARLTGDEAPGPPDAIGENGNGRLRVALVGHPYNLYDGFSTHNLLRRLRGLGLDVTTSDRIPRASGDGATYWTYQHEIVGAADHALRMLRVDGVIAVAAFACGPDAVMLDTVQSLCLRHRRAFLKLIIDEHTGEAGLVTRIEAFADMLERKRAAGVLS